MRLTTSIAAALLVGVVCAAGSRTPAEARFKVLYAFKGAPADGENPRAAPTMDAAGNLYGTTLNGGGCTVVFRGCGTVYVVEPDGTEAVLYYFTGDSDGRLPYSTLLLQNNTLYGTASQTQTTYGTVFALPTTGGQFQILHDFVGSPDDGAQPQAGLLLENGNLFGTTVLGGKGDAGAIFQITGADNAESLLYSFTGAKGQSPYASPIVRGRKGTLFGTTWGGGSDGCGTAYALSASGTQKLLHSFPCSGNDGGRPIGGLLLASDGNFYGTTTSGGGNGCGGLGCGTIYRIAPDGSETVVYSFVGGIDGSLPYSTLVKDKNGNLYGTTVHGGGAQGCTGNGCGTVFKFVPLTGKETVLHAFTGGADGGLPYCGLMIHGQNLYGTASFGGNGYGTVYRLPT